MNMCFLCSSCCIGLFFESCGLAFLGRGGGGGCCFVFWWFFFLGEWVIFFLFVCLLLESMIIFKSEFVGDH